MYEVFERNGELKLLADFELLELFPNKKNLLIVREDQTPEHIAMNPIALATPRSYRRLLILRDHYNNLASRWAYYVQKERLPETSVGDRFLELYESFTAEIEGKTSFLPGVSFILFNNWLNDESYRSRLIRELNLVGTSEPLSYLTDFGSSFSDTSVDPAKLDNRWSNLKDEKIYKSYASHPTLVESTKRIFGMPLPNELNSDIPIGSLPRASVLKPPAPIPANDGKTNVLVFSSFKTGSRAMQHMLQSGLDSDKYSIQHDHNTSLYNYEYDVLVTTVRPHAEIFKSAYFQDITRSIGYPYSLCLGMPGESVPDYETHNLSPETEAKRKKVLETPVEELVAKFLNFPWETYPWLNLKYTIRWINIAHEPFLRPQLETAGYQIFNLRKKRTGKPVKAIFITSRLMGDITKLREALSLVGLNINLNEPQLVNVTKTKWYGTIYEKFLEMVPPSFDKKFNHLDLC